jgi:hypothetical protein
MLVFSCANCGRKYEKEMSLAGKKVRCKGCGQVFEVPRPSRMPSTAAVAPARPAPAKDAPRAVKRSARPVPPAASVLDPYGLDDVPVASAEPVDRQFDEEFVVPQRSPGSPARAKPRRKPTSDLNPGIPFFDGLPWYVYAIVLGILVLGFPLKQASRDLAGYSQLTGFALMLLIMLYGVVGLVAVPFKESLYHGFCCWLMPPFLIGYIFSRWDVMKGSFLTCLGAAGLAVVVGVFAPLVNGGDGRITPTGVRPTPRLAASGRPGDDRRHQNEPMPGMPQPPPGFEAPNMANSISLVVSGLDHESGKAFGGKLTELVTRVSGGYQISSSGSGGKSTYSISMVNPVDVKAFADQITWARVTRVSGQTITIDATAPGD